MVFFIILKQRKISNPQQIKRILRYQIQLFRQLTAKLPQTIINNIIGAVCHNQGNKTKQIRIYVNTRKSVFVYCVKCPMCGKDVVIRKTKKGRRYYGCENNPECEFMSWQKPSEKKCPQCGNYMVEKGNKLLCSNEQCGYTESIKKEKEN